MTKCPACSIGELEIHDGTTAIVIAPTFYVRGNRLLKQIVPVTFESCNRCEYVKRLAGQVQSSIGES